MKFSLIKIRFAWSGLMKFSISSVLDYSSFPSNISFNWKKFKITSNCENKKKIWQIKLIIPVFAKTINYRICVSSVQTFQKFYWFMNEELPLIEEEDKINIIKSMTKVWNLNIELRLKNCKFIILIAIFPNKRVSKIKKEKKKNFQWTRKLKPHVFRWTNI